MQKNQVTRFFLCATLLVFLSPFLRSQTSMVCPYEIRNYTSCKMEVGYEIFVTGCNSTSPPCIDVVTVPAAIGLTPGIYTIPTACCPVVGQPRDIFVNPKSITGCATCFVFMHQSVNGIFTCPTAAGTPNLNSIEYTTSASYPSCGTLPVQDHWFNNHTDITQ